MNLLTRIKRFFKRSRNMEGMHLCTDKDGNAQQVTVKKKGRGYSVIFPDGTRTPLQWVQKMHTLTPYTPPTDQDPPAAA